MSTELEPEEVQAILDPSEAAPAGAAGLELRDFSRPCRLGSRRLAELVRDLRAAAMDAGARLRAHVPSTGDVELVDVSEVGCDGLFAELAAPFCLIEFDVAGQPGWILWELEAAIRAIEVVLGTAEAPDEVQPRQLSRVELGVAQRVLATLCEDVCAALGVRPQSFRPVTRPELVADWTAAGEAADPARAAVRLLVHDGERSSHVRLWVPGVAPGEPAEAARPDRGALPDHLRDVQLELVGYLASVDVPLAQLLALEVGDVIPLRAPAGTPIHVCAEGRAWAEARLGTVSGQLGLSIERMLPSADDEVSP